MEPENKRRNFLKKHIAQIFIVFCIFYVHCRNLKLGAFSQYLCVERYEERFCKSVAVSVDTVAFPFKSRVESKFYFTPYKKRSLRKGK